MTKHLIKPVALRPNDKVALVCPASRPESPAVIQRSIKLVEELGFRPVLGKHVLSMHGHMAGTNEQRLEDFMTFIDDDSVAGLFCITGGFGSIHLLPNLNYSLIAAKPKVLIGGNDNTHLLLAIHARSNLMVLYGPNLDEISTKYTFEIFKEALTAPTPLSPISATVVNDLVLETFYTPVEGLAEGTLIGGNLTALVSLMGTPYQPKMENKILFLEDKNERNDILDRWFTTLYVAGVLEQVKAVALGQFANCGTKGAYNMLSLEDLLGDRLKSLGKPACFGLPIGAGSNASVVPIGIYASFNAAKGCLEFTESALI
ncbi:MAG: LD-carboxypeptidase [Candidatus Melainabacteria bacterium]|nr:LD-carboxypeptidase [Candidatus Melainabacteria bacterium]